jgi:hypothetical protein
VAPAPQHWLHEHYERKWNGSGYAVGLKRKFSCTYFRENFAKIFAKIDAKIFVKTKIEAKIFAKTKISTNINAIFWQKFSRQFLQKRKFLRTLTQKFFFLVNHILNRLFHNFLAEIFATIFAKTKSDAKMRKVSRKRKFLRFLIFAWFSLFAKMKKTVFVSTLGRLLHLNSTFSSGKHQWKDRNRKEQQNYGAGALLYSGVSLITICKIWLQTWRK